MTTPNLSGNRNIPFFEELPTPASPAAPVNKPGRFPPSDTVEARNKYEVPQEFEDLKCKELSSGIDKPSSSQIVGSKTLDAIITTSTPQKTYAEQARELPESYRVIADLFSCMISSLWCIALRKKLPAFRIISRQVEALSERMFSIEHLAQIKYILPEAVHLDEVLVQDIKTLCVEPDIKITLSFDVIEVQQKQSPYIALKQLFMSRLLDMATKLQGVHAIPEAELPEPFNRFFSKKRVVEAQYKTPLLASQIPTSSSNHECSTGQETTSISKPAIVSDPAKLGQQSSSVASTVLKNTPLKVEVRPGNLMLQTPASLTPSRSFRSCDDKPKNITAQTGTPYSAKRLDFCAMGGGENFRN